MDTDPFERVGSGSSFARLNKPGGVAIPVWSRLRRTYVSNAAILLPPSPA